MKLVRWCYGIKYILKKIFGIESNTIFYEKLIMKYYNICKSRQSGINKSYIRKKKIIISMTSIPVRIDKVWIVVESLLRQTYKPDQIILWLAKDEFKDCPLPSTLKAQQKRGLQIRYCENLKSYKKFYYAIKESPNDFIVTVDDDIIYAENLLETLVKTYRANPGCIVCTRSHFIKVSRDKLYPYNNWIMYEDRKFIDRTPSFHNFLTGGAGALFPAFLLDKNFLNKDVFLKLAPYADDVWLNFWAWVSDIKIVNTNGFLGYIIGIHSSSNNGLVRINVLYQKNDEQIKQVLKYCNIDFRKYLN